MATKKFNSKVQVDTIRASVNQRLGEIITDIIGDDRIQALFEKEGKHPPKLAAQSTGDIALSEGIISPNTKTALLVAQAAEFAWRLATEAGDLAKNHVGIIEQHRKKDERYDNKKAHVVNYTDNVFRFVGQAGDPPLLTSAQATWMTAQIYYNNEITSLTDAINSPGYVGGSVSMEGYEGGFRKAAAGFYAQAAGMLKQEGHTDAAAKLQKVADSLDGMKGPEGKYTPAGFISSHLWNEGWAAQQVNIVLSGDYQSVSSSYETRLKEIAGFLPPEKPKEHIITLKTSPKVKA